MDGYLGEVRLFAGGFAPVNWLDCDGSTLKVASYMALFSLLGNIYGGDSERFALPDLRGRAPIGIGKGDGLSEVLPGQKGGAERATGTAILTAKNVPAHPHEFNVSTDVADVQTPGAATTLAGHTADGVPSPVHLYRSNGATQNMVAIHPDTIGPKSKQPEPVTVELPTRSPFLGLRYIICVAGIYPDRPAKT